MLRLACHSIEIPAGDTVPEWVHLLPIGREFYGRDGRGPYRIPDQAAAQRIIEATTAYQKGADLPIDYDHQLVFSQKNGQPAIAAGWIKELSVRPDGIWGRVEWTEKAAAHVVAREYRYLSPMFPHDKDGNVLRLAGAGLVNMPNLQLTAIASQHGEDRTMDLIKILAMLFGLPETSDQAAIVAHCQKLLSGFSVVAQRLGIAEANNPALIATAAQAAFAKVATALGQPETATIDQLATAAAQLVTANGAPDPSKWVAMAQYQAVADELKTLKGAQIGAEVDAAIKAGKIIPAQRDTMLAWAGQDLAGFKKFVEAQPAIVTAGQDVTGQGKPPGTEGKLTDEELAICKQLGVSPEDFAKNKEAV